VTYGNPPAQQQPDKAIMDDVGGMLTPLTWHTALTVWRPAWVADTLVLLAALAYVTAAQRARRRHGWPWWRTAIFLTGLAALVVALNSSIEIYSHMLFWIHMILHLLLIMVVPVFLVAGHPIALWRAAGGPPVAGRLPGPLRAAAEAASFPVVTLALYAGVLVGTHLTSFMQVMLTHLWVHDAEQVLYLVSGYLFFLPLIGSEPIRWRTAHPLRLFLLFFGMTVDTVIGVVLVQTTHELFPAYAAQHRMWGPGLAEDLRWGGAVMWIGGDGLMLLVMLIVMFTWLMDTTSRESSTGTWLEAARRGALAGVDHAPSADAATIRDSQDVDDDAAALDAYNAMLARLARTKDPGAPERT
jgi:putative copper resistance protein D